MLLDKLTELSIKTGLVDSVQETVDIVKTDKVQNTITTAAKSLVTATAKTVSTEVDNIDANVDIAGEVEKMIEPKFLDAAEREADEVRGMIVHLWVLQGERQMK
jgi:hypothetical protein